MKAEEILNSDEIRRIKEFHGHVCPGMMIGYRAAKEGLERLSADRAEDEEVVAIVENDACGVDAVQVLTGCTFGKGNFMFLDYGKQAFTFFNRRTGKGVRLALKGDALSSSKTDSAVFEKVRSGQGSEEDVKVYRDSRQEKIHRLLEAPVEDLFDICDAKYDMPPKAVVMSSEACAKCGEPTMPTKMVDDEGGKICRGCAG